MRILDAVAELIDASLTDSLQSLPPRLRSIHFPAALDWIRIEDVIRVAASYRPAISRTAILNRWPAKEDLVRAAALHCMLYRDLPGGAAPDVDPQQMMVSAISSGLAAVIAATADGLLKSLLRHPRRFLLMHLAPMLPMHADMQKALAKEAARTQEQWIAGYVQLMGHYGVVLRPEWTLKRLALALQLLLDGYMVRSRVDPDLLEGEGQPDGSLFAAAAVTLVNGAVDWDLTGSSAAEFLDRHFRSPFPTGPAGG